MQVVKSREQENEKNKVGGMEKCTAEGKNKRKREMR